MKIFFTTASRSSASSIGLVAVLSFLLMIVVSAHDEEGVNLLRGKLPIGERKLEDNTHQRNAAAAACPEDNWCHHNARCVLKEATTVNSVVEKEYDCLCDEADGWTGDGYRTCADFDECANNANTCVPTDKGGFCTDRDPNMVPAKYFCGCLVGFFPGPNPNSHGAIECLNVDECALGIDTCHAKAFCMDTFGGYTCSCAVSFFGNGHNCELSADDLDIRFSKIAFEDGNIPEEATLPLTSINYPMNNSTFQWIRYSEAHSVTIKEFCIECDISSEELIAVIGGGPLHPSSNSKSPYWSELEHVVDVQVMRRAGNVDPKTIMPMPALWAGRTMDDVADSVHDEYPGIQHVALIQVMDGTTGLTVDNDVIPFTVKVEFIREIVMVADLVTWAVARVGPLNFGIKWAVGRVRPEEIAYQISEAAAGSSLASAAPPGLMTKIKSLSLTSGESFTAYPEGSPNHPSWPAMHSAGSAASLWMAVVLDLTEDEWCQVKLTDYAVSYARTVAGMHYVTDNIAGLALGQEIVARRLPRHLNYYYGSNIAAVEAKIASKRFDWTTFLDSDCAKQGFL